MKRPPSYPGSADTQRTALPNGLTLLARENHSAPVVVLEGMLTAGALDDPTGLAGISSFTANMLTRGSEHYSYRRFNEIIESVGASLSITTDSDSLNFGITCLSEDFPTLVEVLADSLRRPVFDAEQFTLVRGQKLVRLQERDQETGAVANLRFYESLYPAHPLGAAVSGYVETVGAIRLEDLAAFHAAHYTPHGGVIAVSGDVVAPQAIDLLAHTFGDWQGAPHLRSLAEPAPLLNPARVHATVAGKVQSDITLGVRGIPRTHPDHAAVRVANTILGVFGMMGRLGEVVREQQGLAYYAYSSQDSSRDSGVWMAAAGVNPANVEQAVVSILAEIERLAAEPVLPEELADSQAYLTGSLPLTLETNDGIASTLLNLEWYSLGLDYLAGYSDEIFNVTIEDIQRVAQSYLRADGLVVVTAGPGAPST